MSPVVGRSLRAAGGRVGMCGYFWCYYRSYYMYLDRISWVLKSRFTGLLYIPLIAHEEGGLGY